MARKVRKCRCGHERGHPLVDEEAEYTFWGWIQLSMFGFTPKPDHIVYRCTICRKSLGTTRDPAILERRYSKTASDVKDVKDVEDAKDAK